MRLGTRRGPPCPHARPPAAVERRTLDDSADAEVDHRRVDDSFLVRRHKPVALLVHVQKLNLHGKCCCK